MIPARKATVARRWEAEGATLESALLIRDFFRLEGKTYKPNEPFVLCEDAGLLAVFRMEGLDPEPLNDDALEDASAAMTRAIECLNPASLGEWAGGTVEVQSLFRRWVVPAPRLARPAWDSAAQRELAKACQAHWDAPTLFDDEILYVIKFVPQFKDLGPSWMRAVWSLLGKGRSTPRELRAVQQQAQMMRRVLRTLKEHLGKYSSRRPRMGFGFRHLNEQDTYEGLWRAINHRDGSPGKLRKDLPLVRQLTASERNDHGTHYEINGRPTKVLTWKIPPSASAGHFFARLQTQVRFPFSVSQTFRAQSPRVVAKRIGLMRKIASALVRAGKEDAKAYLDDAERLLQQIGARGEISWNWSFALVVDGADELELEDRVARLTSQLKAIQERDLCEAGEPLEERENRLLAELASLPGNGQLALRENIISSRNVGHLAPICRLSKGDVDPDILFFDRQGGAFGYSLFSRREPSWNKLVLGLSGEGKSVVLNSMLSALGLRDSQVYVLDRGNSFGAWFEMAGQDSPAEVSSMHLGGSSFRFHPVNMPWAIAEKERQQRDGTWQMPLEDGDVLPCPLETTKIVFSKWIAGLASPDAPLSASSENRLDRALKGPNGEGGFFRAYENESRRYLRQLAEGKKDARPPRPLTSLLTFINAEAPELKDAIELWTRPPQSMYFDSGTDNLTAARLVYLELTGLDEQPKLAGPFIGALLATLWRRIQNPRHIRQRKAILVDEVALLVRQPGFFGLLNECSRTIRKYGGCLILSTQNPNDLSKGAMRVLLQNVAEVFLYKGFSEPEFMANDMHLEPHHCRLHQDLRSNENGREVYYVSVNQGTNRVLTVSLPAALYWYVTTDAADKHWRQIYCRRLGLSGGVKALVAACDGKTVENGVLRIERVTAHARALGWAEADEQLISKDAA
jgi:hypothetical protein